MTLKLSAVITVMQVVQGLRRNSKVHSTKSTCGMKGGSSSLSEIVNGDRTSDGEWPWQVQLRRGTHTFCGGTLLSPMWVLTAASCLPSADFDVVVGGYDQDRPSGRERSHGVLDRFKHPLYNRSGKPQPYDVAMLRLDHKVQMNDNVGAACLPEAEAEVPANTSCWITGWGAGRSGGSGFGVLQEAEVDTLSNADCVSKFAFDALDESLMCARGEKSFWRTVDACGADAGGPLVCERDGRWTLHGVTSRTKRDMGGCGEKSHPTLWTRVSKVSAWIQEFLAGGCPNCTLSPPPQCNGLAKPPYEQFCPGGIPCPKCGTQRCMCPL